MAIIKRTLKYGTALGVTYLSVEQRLWSELSHKQIKDKLAVVSAYGQKAEKFVVRQTGVDVSQWRPTTLHVIISFFARPLIIRAEDSLEPIGKECVQDYSGYTCE
ncbi:unnamed protein product [Medioppia subpectinata]|uniref:Uncharacterized protein n=1 Tax=Medioppia subpectinata TaxID=1979941 RepID=A0A7R9Q7Y9_9ACAR|nr:unnamed protein product [Medioppia subpectinata]CAG2116242.1 unnamed protein product [Medioppia subpectinata]